MDEWEKESWLGAIDESYLEKLWEQYQAGPSSNSSWEEYVTLEALREFYNHEKAPAIELSTQKTISQDSGLSSLTFNSLLASYRTDGHLYAKINPFQQPETIPASWAKTISDIAFNSLEHSKKWGCATAAAWQQKIHELYCGSLGLEIATLDEQARNWGYELYEKICLAPCPDKLLIQFYERLAAAEGLEKALASKFPGAKRFSLEGLDSFVILLESILKTSATECGVREATLGLSHRGRLNIMINTLGKNPGDLFKEFSGQSLIKGDYSGDVKYHQGFSTELSFNGHDIHIALSFNPSHLEIVGPVIQGSTRARKDKLADAKGSTVLPIIIHGDAAISGQGVVMEILNMSKTPDYGVGGTIHIVLNNQIGFTTSKSEEARSTRYCTDIAKMINAPVIHVNAEDPIAVWRAALWAAQYRAHFAQDVFIDLIGYRRLGHNEADEPSVTQPSMYAAIAKRPTALALWGAVLSEAQILTTSAQGAIKAAYREKLDSGQVVAPYYQQRPLMRFFDWAPYMGKGLQHSSVSTAVPLTLLKEIGQKIIKQAQSVKLHSRLEKLFEARSKMYSGDIALDWGAAELLAYGCLLTEGYSLRLSGQDSQRGTFFHRHAVVFDVETGKSKNILEELASNEAKCAVINSLLSEMAVMGFEYGYSMTDPETLVIWEAQFGDFANGAQVVIDQFLCSGEKKWQRLCGLTLFLPHGYEGQGPEHSSARIERFLQLAAQDNMRVAYPSTPAQIFHLIRSQMKAHHRHPLIVFTPKSLLRLPAATSPLSELASGSFKEVLFESSNQKSIRKIIFCTGKIYYEILTAQREKHADDILVVRLEQLYPFPKEALQSLLSEYNLVHDLRWVQEEPKNQGAWFFIQPLIEELSLKPLTYIGRTAQASPAVGSSHEHERQQNEILKAAVS